MTKLLTGAGVDAGASFSPLDIAGCAAWWKGDAITDIVTGLVHSWPDSSGNSRTLDNPLSLGWCPTYVAAGSGLNGHAVAQWDGIDDFLGMNGPLFTGTKGHILMVITLNTAVTCAPWSQGKRYVDSDHYTEGLIYLSKFGTAQIDNDAIDFVSGDDALPTNTWCILEWASTGTEYKLWRNGDIQSISVIAGANNGDWFGDTATEDRFCLGGRWANTLPDLFITGKVAEVIVYDDVNPTAPEQALLEGYVSAKYGLALV